MKKNFIYAVFFAAVCFKPSLVSSADFGGVLSKATSGAAGQSAADVQPATAVQLAAAQSAAGSTALGNPSTQDSGVETDEVMIPGYANPYRWNRELKGEAVNFKEIWGYVIPDYIDEYNKNAMLTDIGLFAAEIDIFGNLSKVPQRSAVADFKGRVHLTAVCDSRSLSHLVLSSGKLRTQVANDLALAAREFDGVQIDFELVPPEDAENYLLFLKYLKKKLGKKPLTVCVHARVKTLDRDAESYSEIGKVADRIMIMAYDEHWSTSAPGAIASMDWCRSVAEYALSLWPAEKYIMGLPFYGRTWPEENWRKAWYFEGINRIMHENNVDVVIRENDVPYFSFKKEILVTGWYEDAHSVVERSRMYKDMGFQSLAFWRMGQEDAAVWQWIKSFD